MGIRFDRKVSKFQHEVDEICHPRVRTRFYPTPNINTPTLHLALVELAPLTFPSDYFSPIQELKIRTLSSTSMPDNSVSSVTAAARNFLETSHGVLEDAKVLYAGDVKAFKDASDPLRKPGFVPEKLPVDVETKTATMPRAAAGIAPSKFIQSVSTTRFLRPSVLPSVIMSQVRHSCFPRTGMGNSMVEKAFEAGGGMRSLTSSVYRLGHKIGNPLYYAICVSVLTVGVLVGVKAGGVFDGKKKGEEGHY